MKLAEIRKDSETGWFPTEQKAYRKCTNAKDSKTNIIKSGSRDSNKQNTRNCF